MTRTLLQLSVSGYPRKRRPRRQGCLSRPPPARDRDKISVHQRLLTTISGRSVNRRRCWARGTIFGDCARCTGTQRHRVFLLAAVSRKASFAIAGADKALQSFRCGVHFTYSRCWFGLTLSPTFTGPTASSPGPTRGSSSSKLSALLHAARHARAC